MKVLLLILLATPILSNAQSAKDIKKYEYYCGEKEGAGLTSGTKAFNECVNHFIGPMLIKQGLAKRYTGSTSDIAEQEEAVEANNLSLNDRCLKANDYEGCMKYHSDQYSKQIRPSRNNKIVNIQEPATYNYDAGTVSALEIRGSYGRYITFIGKTVNQYEGTPGYYNPGSPGRQVCNTYGNTYGTYGYGASTSCNTVGYVAPSYSPGTSGGTQHRNYRYELDCRDMTFDRKGDFAGGMSMKGWMHVRNDPTAQDAANRYCPIIDSLPRVKRK